MARQGTEKRRTGCVTCKKRRVKCDEARPVCKQCRIGTRPCAYVEPPVGTYSWQQLLQARPSISPPPSKSLPQEHVRNLDYFRCVVAPALGGQLGAKFWTEPVLQIMLSEDAAMHAMLAISMLYEGFEPTWKDARHDNAALKHYTHSLRLVGTKKLQDGVVLVASVLFICIEFLRGNIEAAILHCRHGMLMSRTAKAQDEAVVAILQHLSIFPHFFSTGDFPVPATQHRDTVFTTRSSAAIAMDDLMGQSIRLVRSLDAYRLGGEEVSLPAGARTVQLMLLENLQQWKTQFEAIPSRCDEANGATSLLMMRFLVCWIWLSVACEREETATDGFCEHFSQIVNLAKCEKSDSSRSSFTFEMGMAPLLHFVVIKCRHLSVRLRALEAIRKMGNLRESLWDASTMYAIGKCIIEREHGIVITSDLSTVRDELPEDDCRVRDSFVEDEVFEHIDEDGKVILRRRLCLFLRKGAFVSLEKHWIASMSTYSTRWKTIHHVLKP